MNRLFNLDLQCGHPGLYTVLVGAFQQVFCLCMSRCAGVACQVKISAPSPRLCISVQAVIETYCVVGAVHTFLFGHIRTFRLFFCEYGSAEQYYFRLSTHCSHHKQLLQRYSRYRVLHADINICRVGKCLYSGVIFSFFSPHNAMLALNRQGRHYSL